jgi:D-alanyl-D-alanine carboxypeptidase
VHHVGVKLTTNRRTNLLAVALLAATAAACGSGSTSVSPSPETPISANSILVAETTPTALATVLPSLYPVPLSGFDQTPPGYVTLDNAMAASLQEDLDALLTSKAYPGLAAAIAFPDGTVWSGQSGVAIVSSDKALTADTLFSIGSISKTFVSALVGRLVGRGVMGIDDTLSDYLPDFPNAANITLRQLLNHTSGIRDLFDRLSDQIAADPTRVWTADEVLAGIGNPYFRPGTNYHYSNTNYILLGLAIEKATGQTVSSLVRSEFLTPLGLDNTFLQTEEDVRGSEAHGYLAPASAPVDNSAGAMIPYTAMASAVGPAGAYVSTASDVARWGEALYDGQILDQASLSAMVDVTVTVPFKPRFLYGLGMEQANILGQHAWGHRGRLDGFWSAMWYLPESHITIVVTSNADWCDPVAAAISLAQIVLA